MLKKHLQDIKIAQKESLILRELSKYFHQIVLDDPELAGMFISKVKLSADKSICTVFFSVQGGQEQFENKRERLVLYKPSLRRALSQNLALRRTPQLVFKYDRQFEKQQRIEELLDKVKLEEEP